MRLNWRMVCVIGIALSTGCGREPTAPRQAVEAVPSLDIDVSTGTMRLQLQFSGTPLADLALSQSAQCSYAVYRDPPPNDPNNYGTYVRALCSGEATSGVEITGLPPGDHTFEIRYQGYPYPRVASATVSIVAGQTVDQPFELAGAMGLVKGTLKVNGALPSSYEYMVCSAAPEVQSIYPCVYPAVNTGAVAYLEVAGARSGVVRGSSAQFSLARFAMTVGAGATVDVGEIAAEVATLPVELQYGEASLSDLRLSSDAYCQYAVYIDPTTTSSGQFVRYLCGWETAGGAASVSGLPTGRHTIQVRYMGAPGPDRQFAIVGAATLDLAAGANAVQSFDLAPMMGLVRGTATINGSAPPAWQYLVCTVFEGNSYGCNYLDQNGAFRYLDLAGSRTGTIRSWSSSTGADFSYSVTAGSETDVGTVSGDQTSLTFAFRYKDVSLSQLGLSQGGCPFIVYRDPTATNPWGTYVTWVCDWQLTNTGLTVSGLPTGAHTFQIRWSGAPAVANDWNPVVAEVAATLVGGQTTTAEVELSGKMGLVSGTLKVNNQIPPAFQYQICSATTGGQSLYPCYYTEANTGAFKYLDIAGARLGGVRSVSSNSVISTFGYSLTAGQTTLVGTTSGGASGNTEVGASVTVKPTDSNTGTTPATLVFSEVKSPGQTTVSTGNQGPKAPKGLRPGNPATYYNIASTASFTSVEVCINYGDMQFTDESKIELLHGNPDGSWTKVTTSKDTDANVICGKVTSFSPFLIVEPEPEVNLPPVARITGAPAAAVDEGTSVTLVGGTSSDADGTIVSHEWDWDGDGTFEAQGTSASHTFEQDGTHPVALRVTDNAGVAHTTSVEVEVANVAPSVSVPAAQSIFKRAALSSAATFTDPGTRDGPWSYSIAWGDGSSSTGQSSDGTVPLTHTYVGSGNFTVSVTVTEKTGGPSDTEEFSVTVQNRAPAIASMGGPYATVEGTAVTFVPAASDPDGDPLTYRWTFGDPSAAGGGTSDAAAPSYTYRDDGADDRFTATLVVTDDEGLSSAGEVAVSVANADPVITGSAAGVGGVDFPTAPVAAGQEVTVTARFSDAGVLDTHEGSRIVWDVDALAGSPNATPMSVTSVAGGTATFTRTLGAGVYTVRVTITDDDGGSATTTAAGYVVVYDPNGGFVTGGGWIDSPAGALAGSSATGRANFGFVSKYVRGLTTPVGNTEFQFHAGALDFKSSSYEWLVVAGARAQYKGEGTIKGRPGETFRFLLTAVDAALSGGGSVDRFRIKITSADGSVVYDNGLNAGDDSDTGSALRGGNISIKP